VGPGIYQPDPFLAEWKWDFFGSAFGDHAADEDPDGDGDGFVMNLRYPGQQFDVEISVHHNYFRDYEPGAGRYLESDPIGLKGGIDTYQYVAGGPFTSIDPLGLCDQNCGVYRCKAKLGQPNQPPDPYSFKFHAYSCSEINGEMVCRGPHAKWILGYYGDFLRNLLSALVRKGKYQLLLRQVLKKSLGQRRNKLLRHGALYWL